MPLNRLYIFQKIILLIIVSFISFTSNAKDYVVVIDAGHGGKDIGAVGLKSYEKDINLAVALKAGKLIESIDGVKVVYTRDDDTFISLQERANRANKANGNIFISIHTNSIDKKNKNRTRIQGSATYTLGLHRSEENLEVAKRENSVIQLEKDYSTTYKGFDPNSTESYIIFEINQRQHMNQSVDLAALIQKEFSSEAERVDNGVRQAGFWVLAATSMPAVLVELDFICNPTQEEFLISDDGQDKLAKSIYKAFAVYKQSFDVKKATVSTNINKEESKTLKRDQAVKKAKVATVETPVKDEDINYQASIRGSRKKSKSTKKQKTVVIAEVKEKSIDTKLSVKEESVKASESNEEVAEFSGEISYKIQLLSSDKKVTDNNAFKNVYPIGYYKEAGQYKYTFGETRSLSEAKRLLNSVRPKFKEAFIVKFVDGKRVNN